MAKKRKDGRYQQSFTFAGKRYTVYATVKSDLAQKVSDKLNQLQNAVESHQSPTLFEYNQIYVDFKRSKVKESTLRNYSNWFKLVSNVQISKQFKLKDMKLEEIRPDDIIKVQKYLLDQKLSARTINGSLSHLSNIFKMAVKCDLLLKNPCCILENVKDDKLSAAKTIHRALTTEETEKFFKNAEGNHYINAFKLMIQTGIRIGELGALNRSDVNLQNNVLIISKTIARDENNNYIVNSTPKTSTSTRNIPLNETVKRIANDQKRINIALNLNKDRLFQSPKGCLIREYAVNREIKKICKTAEIEPFTCHAFRATFATRFIEQRPQDYKVLSEILGHANIKITLDLYTHVMTETKEKAMDALEIAM